VGDPRLAATAYAVLGLAAATGHAAGGESGAYTITVTDSQGAPDDMAVLPVSGPPGAGVAAVAIGGALWDSACLTLGEAGGHALAFEDDEEGGRAVRGYLAKDGAPRTLAWVRIVSNEVWGRRAIVNPLHALDRAARRGLRGVSINAWSAEVAADLARLDLSRVCLTVDLIGTGIRLSGIPAAARYLSIVAGYKSDLAGLSRFRRLLFLRADVDEDAFDAGQIAGMTELQYLRLAAGELRNAGRMAALGALRGLTLRAQKEIERIEFAATMTRLETLSIRGAPDLSPLGGLPSLSELDASGSRVRRLPEVPLPALRTANLMSTGLPDADVDRFRRANPGALVLHRWTPLLRDRLRGATEVTVTVLALTREQKSWSTVVRDRAEVAELVAALDIDDPEHFVLGCMATHRLTFAGANGAEEVELANGHGVRWSGFPGDAPLTKESSGKVRAWLHRHRVDWTDCGHR